MDAEHERWRGGVDARLKAVESKLADAVKLLNDLDRWRWKIVGACIALSTAASLAVSLLVRS